MKKIFLLFIFSLSLKSCALEYEMPGYRFTNFENTKAWELAKAVKDDDETRIRELIKQNNLIIDLKDPKYQQTLLTLSIVNNKKKAFVELLKAGASPNELLGENKDSTPFMTAIEYQEDCDLFYIETLVKFKADINKQIVSKKPNILSNLYSIPLLAAISNHGNMKNECLETVKFLVDNGADVNVCVRDSVSGVCEGVISQCLMGNSLKTLKYFVIEKKISIPEKVYVVGQIDPKTMEIYGLMEALNSKDFQYEDFTNKDTGFVDRSDLRKDKEDILNYLNTLKK
jgi:hypothetical protein